MNRIIFSLVLSCVIITSCNNDEMTASEIIDIITPQISIENLKVPESIDSYSVSVYLDTKAPERVDFEFFF